MAQQEKSSAGKRGSLLHQVKKNRLLQGCLWLQSRDLIDLVCVLPSHCRQHLLNLVEVS